MLNAVHSYQLIILIDYTNLFVILRGASGSLMDKLSGCYLNCIDM